MCACVRGLPWISSTFPIRSIGHKSEATDCACGQSSYYSFNSPVLQWWVSASSVMPSLVDFHRSLRTYPHHVLFRAENVQGQRHMAGFEPVSYSCCIRHASTYYYIYIGRQGVSTCGCGSVIYNMELPGTPDVRQKLTRTIVEQG